MRGPETRSHEFKNYRSKREYFGCQEHYALAVFTVILSKRTACYTNKNAMKKYILGFILIFAFSPGVFADSMFIEGGTGFAKSWHEAVIGLRFQHDTSRLFDQPSYYEAVYLYWSDSNRAQGLGFARSIIWEATERNSFSGSFGLMAVSHKTQQDRKSTRL